MKPSIFWLFAFIPVAVFVEHLGAPAPVVFFSAALAIVPIAALIERSTEHLTHHSGETLGGLLNVTFGNAPELIIALVALKAGYLDMVRASIIGTILVNIILVLGAGFFLGGLRYRDQRFNPVAARTYSSMMLLATISLAMPSAFNRLFAPDTTTKHEQMISLEIAAILLLAYGLYLVFLFKTHPHAFKSQSVKRPTHAKQKPWSVSKAVACLVAASLLAAWLSEILVGAAQGTGKALGMSEVFIGIVLLAIVGASSGGGASIAMACKNRMDLAIGIAFGGATQIALFVAPVLVFASYFIAPRSFELSFARPEIASLFIGVLVGAIVCGDGQSNWFKGVQLIFVYAILAVMFYFLP